MTHNCVQANGYLKWFVTHIIQQAFCTLWGVRSVVMFFFLFFQKSWLPIGLHNTYSISPTAIVTCQKCITKHHDWVDAPQCRFSDPPSLTFFACPHRRASRKRCPDPGTWWWHLGRPGCGRGASPWPACGTPSWSGSCWHCAPRPGSCRSPDWNGEIKRSLVHSRRSLFLEYTVFLSVYTHFFL